MTAVATLQDRFARCGLLVLRGAGLRLGELLDLELDSVIDYGPPGSWLRVPLGKLGTERSVPLDATTLAALDDWAAHRGPAAGAAAPPRRPPHRLPVGVSLDERWTAGEPMASDRGASSCHPAGDGIGVRIWMPTSRSIRKKMNARRHPSVRAWLLTTRRGLCRWHGRLSQARSMTQQLAPAWIPPCPARHRRQRLDTSPTDGRTRDTPRGVSDKHPAPCRGETAGQVGCAARDSNPEPAD
jgi:hypothetical protein